MPPPKNAELLLIVELETVTVPEDQKFIGFEGYKHAVDCLKPGDVVIFTTPPAFRWVHFSYAIQKGVNVFMEKPVTVDGPSTRKMLALADEADKKGLKVGVGLMVRHCKGRKELHQRIRDGEIGDLTLLRGYRMGGAAANTGPKPESLTELMYQIQRFHSFIWASGGLFSDYNIHQIDELCWMKNDWPVRLVNSSAKARPTISLPPPGGYGTMTRTVFAG